MQQVSLFRDPRSALNLSSGKISIRSSVIPDFPGYVVMEVLFTSVRSSSCLSRNSLGTTCHIHPRNSESSHLWHDLFCVTSCLFRTIVYFGTRLSTEKTNSNNAKLRDIYFFLPQTRAQTQRGGVCLHCL